MDKKWPGNAIPSKLLEAKEMYSESSYLQNQTGYLPIKDESCTNKNYNDHQFLAKEVIFHDADTLLFCFMEGHLDLSIILK